MPNSRGVTEIAYAEAVKHAITTPADGAILAVGRRLSQLIDLCRGEEGEDARVAKLAAELRLVLTALGMTPAARSALVGKANPAPAAAPESPLDELKKKRAARGL